MNLKEEIVRIIERCWSRWVFIAIVTGTSGNKVFIRRTGQASADAQAYPRLLSYASPATDDEVLVIWVGGYLVVGEITR